MSEWKKVKLKDCCIKIGSGSTPKGGSMVYVNSGTSLIRSQNVYNLSFDYNGLTHITEDAANKLKGVTVFNEDILLNITGDSVARTCIVPKEVLPARVNQHVAIIRTDRKKMNWRFLNYYLASPKMQAHMLSLAVGKGASRNAMTKQMIENFEVPYPPLSTQHRIATILSRYDSLIENYQKQIKLLEEAAQRLYKEWFIDLHFPGHENTNIIDGVPEGWEMKKVGEIAIISAGGDKPDVVTEEQTTECQVPIYSNGTTKEGLYGYTNKSSNTAGSITVSARGSIGFACLRMHDYFSIVRLISIKPQNNVDLMYLFQFTKVHTFMSNGAAQQQLTVPMVKAIDVVYPAESLLEAFENVVLPLYKKVQSLQSQLRLLAEARDRLLPKLMSGEITV